MLVQGGGSMYFKDATMDDFEVAFSYIEQLWDYNTYDKETIRQVYQRVLNSPDSFAFFLMDDEEYKGFCHGDYFDTFWMSGQTAYVSSIISNADQRRCGLGTMLMDHARELARERGCRALILDSGFPRDFAHSFYENYGFEKSCYGFELQI